MIRCKPSDSNCKNEQDEDWEDPDDKDNSANSSEDEKPQLASRNQSHDVKNFTNKYDYNNLKYDEVGSKPIALFVDSLSDQSEVSQDDGDNKLLAPIYRGKINVRSSSNSKQDQSNSLR